MESEGGEPLRLLFRRRGVLSSQSVREIHPAKTSPEVVFVEYVNVFEMRHYWKPKVDHIAGRQLIQTFFPGTDLDALLADETLVLDLPSH